MSSYKRICYFITGFLLVLKLLVIVFLKFQVRTWEVHEIALNLLKSHEFKYLHDGAWNYNYQFPIYPYCLFFLYSLFGDTGLSGLFLNVLLISSTSLLAFDVFNGFQKYLKFEREFSEKVSLTAVIALQLHPLIAYYTLIQVHPFVMDLFFSFTVLYFMFRCLENKSKTDFLIYSFVFSLAVLNRTTLIALVAPLFFFLPVSRKNLSRWFILVLILPLFSILWIIRNYQYAQTISLNSSLAQNLWIGSLRETEGTANKPDGKTYYELLSEKEKQFYGRASTNERVNFFLGKYLNTVKHKPARIAGMFLIKLKNFWWFRTSLGVDYPNGVKKMVIYYKITYLILLFLALFSIAYTGRKLWIILSYPLLLSFFHALVYVETRHRLIIEPILLFLAIYALFHLYYKLKYRNES